MRFRGVLQTLLASRAPLPELRHQSVSIRTSPMPMAVWR